MWIQAKDETVAAWLEQRDDAYLAKHGKPRPRTKSFDMGLLIKNKIREKEKEEREKTAIREPEMWVRHSRKPPCLVAAEFAVAALWLLLYDEVDDRRGKVGKEVGVSLLEYLEARPPSEEFEQGAALLVRLLQVGHPSTLNLTSFTLKKTLDPTSFGLVNPRLGYLCGQVVFCTFFKCCLQLGCRPTGVRFDMNVP
jgi:hypothetical protein